MGKVLALFSIFLVANQVAGVQIVFDNSNDLGRLVTWDCPYNDNYHDFLASGCERSPSEDIYPERTGFWTGCNAGCELIYNGGKLPKPAKLWFASYVEGDASIGISGKNNQDDPSFEHDFGQIDSQEEPTWCYSEIDLVDFSKPDTSVLNFTITSSTNGFVLIDQIMVDLLGDTIEPISIDIKSDELSMHWSYDDCHYLENYTEFSQADCPIVPIEENPINDAKGFWSPCTATICKIQFDTSPNIVPSSVTIRGYLEDAAQIKVMLPENRNSPNKGPVVIQTISATALGSWVDYVVDLSPYNQYKLDVVLDKTKGGNVMLDSLTYGFDNVIKPQQLNLTMCSPKTTTSSAITTLPTGDPSSTPEGTGGGSTFVASVGILAAFSSITLIL